MLPKRNSGTNCHGRLGAGHTLPQLNFNRNSAFSTLNSRRSTPCQRVCRYGIDNLGMKQANIRLNGENRLAWSLGLFIALVLAVLPVHAEERGGFFSYFPRVPDLHLPRLDLMNPFRSDDFRHAHDAYSHGDFQQAMVFFEKSSEDGNMVADWYLGHMYRLGRGVPPSPAIAYSYYNRVAENFDPEEPDQTRLRIEIDSQLRVADYQRIGIPASGLKANPQAAAHTFLKFATNYGHPRALYALGVMSIEGEGVKANPQQGLKWLYAACRKRSPEAAAYLGELYYAGKVVPKDDTRALTWYIIAADSALHDENAVIFGRLDELRFSVSEDVKLEAEARARVWIEQNPGPPTQE